MKQHLWRVSPDNDRVLEAACRVSMFWWEVKSDGARLCGDCNSRLYFQDERNKYGQATPHAREVRFNLPTSNTWWESAFWTDGLDELGFPQDLREFARQNKDVLTQPEHALEAPRLAYAGR